MKLGVGVSALALALASAAGAQPVAHPWDNRALSPDRRAALLVDAMTLDEQISILRPLSATTLLSLGAPLPPTIPAFLRQPKPAGAIGSAAFAPAIPRLGMPALQESDAGLGVANMGIQRPGDEATALPSGLALASTFDLSLARAYGDTIGAEAHAKGFNVQLAGAVNLVRDPRGGRNFEYGGEDPLLAGLIGGETIAGVQDRHVVSTVKHFALNDQETGRMSLDARIDEAALRESDLLAFQIAIARGKPGSVMCAYNKINGAYACEDPFLLRQVLKGEWKYPGWVMSDWGAVHSLKPAIEAGLDQQSPQGADPDHFAGLSKAVESREIPRAEVREMAFRMVRAFYATGAMDDPARPGGEIDRAGHAAIAQHVAEAGMVLLKNDGLFPLASSVRTIAVIGGHADRGVPIGGGSSMVTPYGGVFHEAPPSAGLLALLSPAYGKSSPLTALQALRPAAQILFDDGSDPARAAALAAKADVVLVFAVKSQSEGGDAPDLSLPNGQDKLIAAVAAANPHTGVVLETGDPVTMPWLDQVGAVLEAWYPGQRGGEAIAAVLDGRVAPSGRLPVSFPAEVSQLPRPRVPGFDPAKPGGLLDPPPPPFEVHYPEGADVGYRWFEKTGAKPLFPFGYGLTYTRFSYDRLQVAAGKGVAVSFTLRNTGARAGVEVAQLYVAPPGRTHRMVGWARVALKPGETRTVSIAADPRLLASYDEAAHRWRRVGGLFDVYVGSAAGQSRLQGHARLSAAVLPDS